MYTTVYFHTPTLNIIEIHSLLSEITPEHYVQYTTLIPTSAHDVIKSAEKDITS